jgi:hypothetical protein
MLRRGKGDLWLMEAEVFFDVICSDVEKVSSGFVTSLLAGGFVHGAIPRLAVACATVAKIITLGWSR